MSNSFAFLVPIRVLASAQMYIHLILRYIWLCLMKKLFYLEILLSVDLCLSLET